MTRVLLILALVAAAFWVYTIVDCALQPPTRHRGVGKGAWIVITILLPVLGGILWFTIGRGRRSAVKARRAPDDDPEFLGSIGTIHDQDERIRRLEEELALLDSEADDPQPPPAAPGSIPPPAGTRPPSTGNTPGDEGDDSRGQRGAVG